MKIGLKQKVSKMILNIEKMAIMLAIGSFIVVFAGSLGTFGNALSKEEAIEITKRSNLVKEGIATYGFGSIGEVDYHNASWVEQMKTGHASEMYEKVPQGHGIWKVIWVFTRANVWMGYTVIVIVDAETGTLIHEEKGLGLE